MIAIRLSVRPWATYISHSGRPRSSGGARDVADQLIQLATSTGSGHLYVANVVVQIDIVVLHPHRVMQLQRNAHKLAAKRRQGEQPRVCHLAEQLEGESALHTGHVKHADLQGVHVNFGRLAVQHQRVHAVESPHIPPRSSAPAVSPIALRLMAGHRDFDQKPTISIQGVTLRQYLVLRPSQTRGTTTWPAGARYGRPSSELPPHDGQLTSADGLPRKRH